MKSTAQKTAVAALVILGFLAILAFLYLTKTVALQLTAALIFAIALEPAVSFLVRRGIGRSLSIGIALTAATAATLLIIGVIVTPLITEGAHLVNNAPQIVEQLTSNATFQKLNAEYGIADKLRGYASEIPGALSSTGLPALGLLGTVAGGVSSFAVIVILTLFLLVEGPSAWKKLMGALPKHHAEVADATARRAARSVNGFVTGNLLISLIAGIVTLVTLLLLGVPYAFALAALVALFDIIPLVGATIATVVVVIVALTHSVFAAVVALVALLAYQFVEGNFIQTVVYSRSISLSPLLVIIATLVGAELGGIVGVLLAIPLSGVLQVVGTDVLAAYRRRKVS